MTCVLVIDDELSNHQLVAHALEPLHYELYFSDSGKDGVTKARTMEPDMIITDVTMPDISGYELTRILRREPRFALTPILVLTAQSGLQDKLKSFEAGADDYLSKPFESAELTTRVTTLLRRKEASRDSRWDASVQADARLIAVHGLRGGTGASTLAVNLGIGLASLWKKPTALLDLTMTAGQVATMLDIPLKRTWIDIARYNHDELDMEALRSIIGTHESGMSFITAPNFPSQSETLPGETLSAALRLLKGQFEYLVADLPHDFSEPAARALEAADLILMVVTPDMASTRAAISALDTYEKRGYQMEKIKLVLSATYPRSSLSREKIEKALGMHVIAMIPYLQDVFVDAINFGQPPVYYRPQGQTASLFEDVAFLLSKEEHNKSKPEDPSEAWKRVYKRRQDRQRR